MTNKNAPRKTGHTDVSNQNLLQSSRNSTIIEVQQQFSNAVAADLQEAIIAWKEPIVFNELNVPELPTNLLPEVYDEFAKALTESTETPPGLTVMTILGVISACVSKCYTVSPKADWHEPTNIYTMIALPPGSLKSIIFKRCTAPISTWEKAQAEKYQPNIDRVTSEKQTQLEIIKEKRKKSAKTNNLNERETLREEIIELEATLPKIPVAPKLFSNDSTIERLKDDVYAQDGRFGLFSDEGGILDVVSGLYTGGHANIDLLLKGIDGGDMRVSRKGFSFDFNPYLTIVLTVQPVILQNMAKQKSFTGKGLLERFLYVVPKSRLGTRIHNTSPVPVELERRYSDRLLALLDNHNIDEDHNPIKLILSIEAEQEWRTFQLYVEKELKPGGKLSHITGWGGKISGFALRIAGLLHIANSPVSVISTIPKETMNKALILAALLIDHALVAYDSMAVDKITVGAKKIYEWLVNTEERIVLSQSDITVQLKHYKYTSDDKKQIIAKLKEHNIIGEPQKASDNRTTLYSVNPLIYDTED